MAIAVVAAGAAEIGVAAGSPVGAAVAMMVVAAGAAATGVGGTGATAGAAAAITVAAAGAVVTGVGAGVAATGAGAGDLVVAGAGRAVSAATIDASVTGAVATGAGAGAAAGAAQGGRRSNRGRWRSIGKHHPAGLGGWSLVGSLGRCRDGRGSTGAAGAETGAITAASSGVELMGAACAAGAAVADAEEIRRFPGKYPGRAQRHLPSGRTRSSPARAPRSASVRASP